MSKGIVLELKGKEAVLLTPEGNFLAIKRSRRREWLIGEEVDLPPVHMPQIKKKRRVFNPSIALAASILLVFISVFAFPFLGGKQTAIAYVSVDINPSVEMSIDKHVQVISMSGINQAGEEIILLMEDWSGKPLDQVTINLIMVARQQGYLSESQNILISTSFTDDESEGLYIASVDAALQEAEQKIKTSSLDQRNIDTAEDAEEEEFQIHRVKTKKEEHNEAKKKGISPGKYLIYLEAIGQGVEIKLDEVAGSSIAQLAQRLNGVGTILSNKPAKQGANQKENLEDKVDKKEKPKQQKNKGSNNNHQQNDKAKQNKKDQKQDQKKNQKKEEDGKGKGNSNKPGKPEVPSPPTKGQQDKKEQIADELEDNVEEFKRQLELRFPTIPGMISGFRHGQDKEEAQHGLGLGKENNKSKDKGKGKGKGKGKK